MSVGFLNLLKGPGARRIFGERELKIIEKQLWAIRLTRSEKNRLSRDIRRKLEFIKEAARFADEFRLKKGADLRMEVNEAVEVIREDEAFNNIKRIWLFGSTTSNERNLTSDIDIAAEFKELTQKEAVEFRKRVSGNFGANVDVQVFNVLPKKIQDDILKNGRVIYERKDNYKD